MFCPNCGHKIEDGARFCPECGSKIGLPADPQPSVKTDPPAKTGTGTVCPKCGADITGGAIFCGKCGTVLSKNDRREDQGKLKQKNQQKTQPDKPAHAVTVQTQRQDGGARSGETDLGASSVSGGAAVLPPVKGTLHGLGSYFGGIERTVKKPGVLIGVAIIGILWIILSVNRNSDSGFLKFLSFLTFAQGGYGRSFLGTILGVFGRGTVAAALISLFSGGFKNLIKGFGVLFKGRGEKRGVAAIIIGVIAGALLYLAYAGIHATAFSAMAGISGALLALQALGSGSGRLYGLAQSLTSKNSGGVRTAARGSCDGLLTGVTAGFAVSTALSAIISSII